MRSLTAARVTGLYSTPDTSHFRTRPVATLELDLQGIPNDRHYGFIRPAGAREKWYPTGTPIRSGRQITLVSAEELATIAAAMGIPAIQPEWVGANILVQNVPDFTNLPWGTRLFFEHGATLVNEGANPPCRFAGREIAAQFPNHTGLDLLFVKSAKHLRGIVASVEHAGCIKPGGFTLKTPPQKPWGGADYCAKQHKLC